MAGNDVHTAAVEYGSAGIASDATAVLPAADTLFTSGTLGRYSLVLNSVMENREKAATAAAPVAGD
jgi:NADH-quinone oxidoreductase subunit G